jgi:hypothetical protein
MSFQNLKVVTLSAFNLKGARDSVGKFQANQLGITSL